MQSPKSFLVLVSTLGLVAHGWSHTHLDVVATGKTQNSPLAFNEADHLDTSSDFVTTLTFTNSGRYAGHYVGSLTVTALASTPGHPAYAANAAASGSWIFAELTSVSGPPGGVFSFWEANATNPTVSVPSGGTGTNTWRLSESTGAPGSDPYGHIHGRRFTATKPGIYVVSFRALDRSTNGVGGGPIHTPSAGIQMYFQAGDNILSVTPAGGQTQVKFGARAGLNWQVQKAASPQAALWQNVGSPIAGNDHFRQVTDPAPIANGCFYRVKGTP